MEGHEGRERGGERKGEWDKESIGEIERERGRDGREKMERKRERERERERKRV